jgi:hypothetical protein
MHPRIGERAVIQLRELGVRREQARHLRIEIDQRHVLDPRVLQDLAHRQAVAPAEHEHTPRLGLCREPRVHERLVVAVLVLRAELEM